MTLINEYFIPQKTEMEIVYDKISYAWTDSEQCRVYVYSRLQREYIPSGIYLEISFISLLIHVIHIFPPTIIFYLNHCVHFQSYKVSDHLLLNRAYRS